MARHRYRVQLRWSDMDALRHVNNVQFLRFLEDARVQMMVEAGRRGFENELHVVVVRHEIDYRRPLLFRTAPVVVDTWVTSVGRTSYAVAYEVREEVDDVVYATASTVMVCVDARDGQPQPVDEPLRAALALFGDDGGITDGDAHVSGLVHDPTSTR